jgi:hypothetical protein
VLVEAPILDRHRGFRHPVADPGERHGLPVPLGGDHAQPRVVGGVDERVRADLDLLERVQVARGAERRDGCDCGAGDDEQEREHGDEGEHDRAAPGVLALDPLPLPPSARVDLVVEAAATTWRRHA